MKIISYDGTQQEYDRILAEQTALGFILTNVSNITEGNFLGFQEPEWVPPVTEPNVTDRINKLEAQNTELMLAIAEAAEATDQGLTETQLAIAELAEIISGGM